MKAHAPRAVGSGSVYLDLLLVEGDALHDVETRCFVRFGVCVICCLEDGLVLCTEVSVSRCEDAFQAGVSRACATYAVLFLLPFGCRSEALL